MTFRSRASLLLAGIVTLTANIFAPIANASTTTNLGSLSLPFGAVTSDNSLAGNSAFSDLWTFTLGTSAVLVDSQVSSTITETSTIPGYSGSSVNGVQLSSVQLFSGTDTSGNLIAQTISSVVSSAPYYPFTFTTLISRTTDTYNLFLNNISLSAGTYTLAVNGQVFGNTPGTFSGNLSLIANTVATPSAPVPMPAAVWLFSSGLGFLALRIRRKRLDN